MVGKLASFPRSYRRERGCPYKTIPATTTLNYLLFPGVTVEGLNLRVLFTTKNEVITKRRGLSSSSTQVKIAGFKTWLDCLDLKSKYSSHCLFWQFLAPDRRVQINHQLPAMVAGPAGASMCNKGVFKMK